MLIKFPGSPIPSSATGRPVMVLLDALGKRWALRVIWELSQAGSISFRELRGRCEDVSPTSLNQRLKELRALGLVELMPQGYALSDHGRELSKLLMPLDSWAKNWARALESSMEKSQ